MTTRSIERPRAFATLLTAIVATSLGGCGPGTEGPAPALDVAIVGHEHRWFARYPGPDGLLGTPDDTGSTGEIRLPAKSEVHLSVSGADYPYFFRLPEIGVNELAAPSYTAEMTLRTGDPSALTLAGDVMCGPDEPGLVTEIEIAERADFQSWLDTLPEWSEPSGAVEQ